MPESRLPTEYVPYPELVLCSNELIDVKIPVRIGDQPGLLIGWSPLPIHTIPGVWLAAPMSPGSKEWVFIVERNRALRPLIVVEPDRQKGAVSIKVGAVTVIRAIQVSRTRAVVDQLDMRPLGLALFGDERGMKIGGLFMERNQLAHIETAFQIGPPEGTILP